MKNHIAIAALVLALAALGVAVFESGDTIIQRLERFAGVSNFSEIATDGPTLGIPGSASVATQPVKFGMFAVTIGAATNTFYVLNNFADEVVLDEVQLLIAGTASSSHPFEMATSTTGNVPVYDFFANPDVFPRFIIATGTSQTLLVSNLMLTGTTSPIANAEQTDISPLATSTRQSKIYHSGGISTDNALGPLVWRRDEYLVGHLLAGDVFVANTTVCDATGNRNGTVGYLVCENATSSARGFTPTIYVKYHATSTPLE